MLNGLGFRSDSSSSNKEERDGRNSTRTRWVDSDTMDMNRGQLQTDGLPQPTQYEQRFSNSVDPAVAQAIALQAAREQVENGTVVRSPPLDVNEHTASRSIPASVDKM